MYMPTTERLIDLYLEYAGKAPSESLVSLFEVFQGQTVKDVEYILELNLRQRGIYNNLYKLSP